MTFSGNRHGNWGRLRMQVWRGGSWISFNSGLRIATRACCTKRQRENIFPMPRGLNLRHLVNVLQHLVVTTKSFTTTKRDDMSPLQFVPFLDAEMLKFKYYCLQNAESIVLYLFTPFRRLASMSRTLSWFKLSAIMFPLFYTKHGTFLQTWDTVQI